MLDKLKQILSKIDADYADIRYEIKKDIVITFNGKELSQIGSNSTDGYVVRALKDGGFASAVFTKIDDAAQVAKTVVENAKLIGKDNKKPVKLAKTDVVKENYTPDFIEDPRKVSIEEKLNITRRANEAALAHKEIATTNVAYREVIREKTFVTSEGSEIKEDLITVSLAGEIIAKDGNLVQNVRVATGGSDGFHTIRNPEKNFEERTQIAIDLLKATPVKAGTYNCILNPSMAGVFTHEAFGHFSEADIIETLPAMREKMKLGSKLGSDVLNIIDNATIPNQLGFYKYDDEGIKVKHAQLMKNGVLVGRLHSRRTAAEFNEPLSGHCVAEDFRYAPIVRMGTIFIEPGDKSLEELFALLGDGLYILDAKGGQTAGENFTFGAQYGYIVKNGKKAEMIRDINISGNLYKTLLGITAVGKDLVLSKRGGCGKGQINIRSCSGAPHVIAQGLVLGGA
ncbi:MAG: TldD/PmbA family protein [Candidatus Latescibacteria bacterium]|nr:TldD/PmbA family protein [Candidatus Latescibacterota bacterium]